MFLGNALRVRALVGLALLGCFLLGCGGYGGRGGEGEIMPSDGSHILQMNALYGNYRLANNKPPPSPEALKEWAKKQPQDKVAKWINDPLDSVFISPRDHEPYCIAPAPKTQHYMGPQRVVIYEKTGVKGKRMVANGMGYSQEMDETALKTFVPNP